VGITCNRLWDGLVMYAAGETINKEENKMRLIHVTVALYIDEDADVSEVIAGMEYNFEYKDQIRMMEFIDANTEV
jgi:hypothetical protein